MPEVFKEYGSTMVELIENGFIDLKIGKEFTTLQSIQIWRGIAEVIAQMRWCLLYSENENYFICADHPCAVLDPDYKSAYGIGLIGRRVEVTFPISKNHCLLTSWQNVPVKHKLSSFQVKNINKRTALFGERRFAYPIRDQKVLDFLVRYSQFAIKPKVDTIPHATGDCVVASQNVQSQEASIIYKGIAPIFNVQ